MNYFISKDTKKQIQTKSKYAILRNNIKNLKLKKIVYLRLANLKKNNKNKKKDFKT